MLRVLSLTQWTVLVLWNVMVLWMGAVRLRRWNCGRMHVIVALRHWDMVSALDCGVVCVVVVAEAVGHFERRSQRNSPDNAGHLEHDDRKRWHFVRARVD